MLKKIAVLLILLLMGVGVSAQDHPPQLDAALRDLSSRLGVNVSVSDLTAWSFTQDNYDNTGLGCAEVTGAPAPNLIVGYSFSITFGGTVYDYRVSGDMGIVFPCNSELLQVEPPAPPTPVQLVQCPPNYEGHVSSRLAPEMQAQVVSGNDPNRVRIAPATSAEQIGTINPLQPFEILAGPSCSEGYVWWQVSLDGQVGWTAEGVAPDEYYLEPVGVATATPTQAAVATLPPAPTVAAQPAPPPAGITALAGLSGDTTVQFFNLTGPTTIAPATPIFTAQQQLFGLNLVWSPDGQFLAYSRPTETGHNLFITERTGSVNAQLAEGVESDKPPTFALDSATIYYVVNTNEPAGGDAAPTDVVMNVFAVPIDGSSAPQLAATYNFGFGCGGGLGYPADFVYNREAGYQGSGGVFIHTQFGIVHSTNCVGSGVGLLDLTTGEDVILSDSLARVKLSPDGTQLVGVIVNRFNEQPNTLEMIDLASGAVTPIGAIEAPDQVAWGPDGSIYYRVQRDTGQIIPGSDSEAMATQFGVESSAGVPLYEVSLHRVNLTEATDAEIYTATAFAIPRMYVAADNSAIYFSQIANGDQWVAAINNNTPPQDANGVTALFGPALLRLPLDGSGAAQIVLNNVTNTTFNDTAFGGVGGSGGGGGASG
jgi:hypothetical protein